jgi:hypothetical protein
MRGGTPWRLEDSREAGRAIVAIVIRRWTPPRRTGTVVAGRDRSDETPRRGTCILMLRCDGRRASTGLSRCGLSGSSSPVYANPSCRY